MANVQVNLQFQAETSAAMANIREISKLLQQISKEGKINVDAGPIAEASAAAQKLQVYLQQAVNVNTGKINLGQLNTTIQKSGTSITELISKLQAAGPAGQQAFIRIGQAISQAEAPMYQLNKGLMEFGKTLLNTIKWQMASNLIHGIQGALQGAVSHAKNLNSALNDIQIVTGNSSSQMADFADTARQAAKELNTTTIEYSKAALIFFQQGLSGDAVKERTDTVIKLAQVTGQSAEQISSEMTAIWNNFYDGSESLEHYADVITALGASTAASSEEIANGMSKFAAVADTVGLSYEKAAAAVATVVAETRQSADIVGTAFKTILARMESLKLGETLDDGVTLNKYSEALEKIGVNVLDANGNLRQMDSILDDLGKRWNLLSEAQQVALAQTVSGVRQYSQFLALMNNYDEVLGNQNLAETSEGTLKQQAEIWATSWEAASKRVAESTAQIYDQILSDKTLIGMENIFNSLLQSINNVLKASGGIVPVILSIMGIFSGSLVPLISGAFARLKNNIGILTGEALKSTTQIQDQVQQSLQGILESNTTLSENQKQSIQLTVNLMQAKQQLTLASKNMSEAEKMEAQARLAVYEAAIKETQASLDRLDALREEINLMKEANNINYSKQAAAGTLVGTKVQQGMDEEEAQARVNQVVQASTTYSLKGAENSLDRTNNKLEQTERQINTINQALEQWYEELEDIEKNSGDAEWYEQAIEAEEKQKQALEESQSLLEERRNILQDIVDLKRLEAQFRDQDVSIGQVTEFRNSAESGLGTTNEIADETAAQVLDNLRQKIEEVTEANEAKAESEEAGQLTMEVTRQNLEALATAYGNYEGFIETLPALSKNLTGAMEQQAKAANAVTEAENAYNEALNNYNGTKIFGNIKEITEAKKQLEEASKNLVEAQEKEKAASESANQALEETQNVFKAMAEEVGMSKDVIDDLSNKLKEAFESGDSAAVEEIFKGITIGAENAKEATDVLINRMLEVMENHNIDIEPYKILKDKIAEASAEAVKLKGNLENVGNIPNFNQPITTMDLITEGLTKIASGAGRVTMAYRALKSVINVWTDKDASLMDKIATTLMSLSMIIPVIVGLIKSLNSVKAAHNVISQLGNTLTLKEIIAKNAESAATDKQTVSTMALVAAKALENTALMVTVGILALVVAGIIAYNLIVEANTKAIIANNEKKAEAAKKTAELGAKWSEQASSMDTLIAKYKELTKGTEEYNQAVQDIIDAVPELIASYEGIKGNLGFEAGSKELEDYETKIEQLKNAAAAHDIETVEKLRQELDKITSEAAAEQTKQGADAAASNLLYALKDINNQVEIIDYEKEIKKLEDLAAFAQASFDYDSAAQYQSQANAMRDRMNERGASSEYRVTVGGGPTEVRDRLKEQLGNQYDGNQLVLDTSSTSALVESYEKLRQAREDLLASGIDLGGKNDIFDELNTLLDQTEEAYDKAKELYDQVSEFNIEKIARGGTIGNVNEVNNYDEYLEYKEALVKAAREQAEAEGKSADEAERAAMAWLEAQGLLSEYTKADRALSHIGDRYGQGTENEAREFYSNLSEEDKKLFLEIDFNSAATEEAWNAQIAMLRSKAANEKLEVQIQGVETAQGKLKQSGMSQQDWKDIESSVDWDAAGKSFTDFLDMSYNEQKAFLEQTKTDWQEALGDGVEQAVAEAEGHLEELKNAADQADAELEVAKSLVETTHGDDTAERLLEEAQARADAAHKAYEDEEAYITKLQDEKAIRQRLLEDQLRSQIAQAQTLAELDSAVANLGAQTGSVDMNLYWDSLAAMGEKYDNASQETEQFKEALNELGDAQARLNEIQQYDSIRDPEFKEYYASVKKEVKELTEALKEQEDVLRASITAGEAASKYGLDADVIEAQAKAIRKENEALGLSAEQATRMAIANQRMNKGIQALSKNLSSWEKTLSKADKKSMDYAKTVTEITDAIRELVGGLDDFELPDGFLDSEKNLKLLEKAAKGDQKAINELGAIMGQAAVEALEFSESMAKAYSEAFGKDLDVSNFSAAKDEVLNGIQAIQDNMQTLTDGTMTLDEAMGGSAESWVAALNEMAIATGMSVDQMNALLGQLGVQAKVEVHSEPQKMQVPTYTEVYEPGETVRIWQDDPEEEGGGHYVTRTGVRKYTVPGEPITVEGYAQVAQISTENNPMSPIVSYTGTGGGSAGGGVAPSSTGSGGGGGGGGKGGKGGSGKGSSGDSGSADEGEEITPKVLDDEIDRYHYINQVIDNLASSYDRLSKIKDRTFGRTRLAAIAAETNALNKQIDALKTKQQEAIEYYQKDRAAAEHYGAKIDDQGNITNYNEVIASLVAKYNAGLIDDDEYSKAKDALDKFEETADLIQEIADEIEDKVYEKLSLEIEAIGYKVEYNIELNDDDLAVLEYKLGKLEDELFTIAEQIALIGEETANAIAKSTIYNQGLEELQQKAQENVEAGIAVENEGWTQEMIDQAREYRDGLLEVNETLLEYKKTVEESFLKAVDEVTEKLDDQISRFDNYSSILENYINILGLSGKSLKNADLIIELGNKQVSVATKQLQGYRQEYETLQSALRSAQEEYQKAVQRGNEDDVKYWAEQVEEIEKRVEEGKANVLSAFESTLQTAADVFAATVEQLIATMESSLTRYNDLATAIDVYDKAKTINSEYLDMNQKTYELSKLMRNLNKEIEKTDNIGAKQKLRDLEQEIARYQSSEAQMSEYDLKNLQARYELRLAEIALEEAQNAKNTVRLTRNSSGGWGYIYTANDEEIDKAQQDYEDKLYNLQKLAQDQIDTMSENILRNEQEMFQAMRELRAEDFESYEVYLAELQRLRDYYGERDRFYRSELDKALGDAGLTYADTILGEIEPATASWEETHDRMLATAEETIAALGNAYQDWSEQVSEAYGAAGYNQAAFTEQVLDDAANIETATDDLAALVEQTAEEAQDYLDETAEAVTDFQVHYSDQMQLAIDKNEEVIDSINDIIQKLYELNEIEIEDKVVNVEYNDPGYNPSTGQGGQSGSPSGTGGTGGDQSGGSEEESPGSDTSSPSSSSSSPSGEGGYSSQTTSPQDSNQTTYRLKKLKRSNTGQSDYSNESTNYSTVEQSYENFRNSRKRSDGYYYDDTYSSVSIVNGSDELVNNKITYFRKTSDAESSPVDKPGTGGGNGDGSSQIPQQAYASGGYTGEWGPEGKLAMLHEKELVLNKADTSKILEAVSLTREIALSSQLSKLKDSFNLAVNGQKEASVTKQDITIYADFPNVVDQYQIEAAFAQLTNQASQAAFNYDLVSNNIIKKL